MGLMDVLGRYAENPNRPPPQVIEDFDLVAREASEDDIGDGLEEAFRSDATPPFEQMVGQLFDRSGPQERAGHDSMIHVACDPESVKEVPMARREPSPSGRGSQTGLTVPRATPDDPMPAMIIDPRPGIAWRMDIRFMPAILRPLPHVSVHVEYAERIRSKRAGRCGKDVAIAACGGLPIGPHRGGRRICHVVEIADVVGRLAEEEALI